MSQIAATQIPKPRDEQAFERACLILFRELLSDPNVQLNARRGQGQRGVDIFGFRNHDAAHPVGVQCKLKGPDKQLTEREVRHEVDEAVTFDPPLREYFILTTAPDDAKLQTLARELTIKAAGDGRHITINVWGWHTLEQRISEHGAAMQAFDPTYGPFAKQQAEQLDKIGAQQSVIIRDVGQIRQEIGGFNLPGGHTLVQNALEAALDAEIDRYRDILNDGKPKTALALYEAQLTRIRDSASGRILFRVKANIGHCHFALGDNTRAAHWLSESFAHAPTEPKAIANKALSLLLLDKFREAYEYGINELQRDSSNQWLVPMIIQAAARCPDLDDPLTSKIPEPLRELEDVQTTHVDFLRLRNLIPDWWVAARNASQAHPDNKTLLQYRAEADLDEIGRDRQFQRGAPLSPDTRQKVSAAAQILFERWEKRRLSENPSRPDGVAACCNLLAAYTFLGERASALTIARQAISLVPDDEQLIERSAIAGLEDNDYAFTESLLPKLSESPNATLIQFQFYAHTANWPKLVEIAQRSDLVFEHERASVLTMGRLASLMIGTKSKEEQHNGLKEILKSAGEDLRAYVLIADFARKLDAIDINDEAYKRAVAIAEREPNVFGRQMLARSAAQRDDWRMVIQLLDNSFDGSTDNLELSSLATAFVNENPTRKRALDFFNEIDQSVRDLPFYLTAYGLLQSKRGDLASAEKAFERALAIEPENATTLRHLFSVYFRQERSDRIALIRARIQSLNLEKLKGSPQDKIALAHVMRDVGEGQRALAWAYEIVQSNRNDPQVALGYFGLIMARGDAINIPTPSGVGIDTWVSIQNNLGEKQAIVIEDGVDKPADGIYTPGHSFIAPALGLRVGQSFTQARHIGRPETWTILAVKHKYLHALHDIMETFNVRFPEEQGFYRVTTQDGDISPILDEVKTHSERSQAIVDLYIEKKIPLAFMAAMTRNEVIKFASGISQSGQDIAACYGNNAERAAAEDLVRTYANKGAVFDCYTVWTAEALGILPALRKLFGTLLVPRSAIDDLAIIQHEMEQNPGPVMTVIYRDGQYFREQLTAEENDARIKAFGERRRNIERHCEIVPVDVPDSASDLARGLIEQTDSHILDSAFLAADKNGLLLSDDLYYRQIVQQACGTKGTFLQASITIAAARGLLDGPALAAAIVGVAALRHAHVALSPAILFEIVKQDKTDRQLKFRTVTEFIGTKACEINSHVHVTIIFMIQVWNFDFPDVVKQACSGIIIQQLLRYRQTDYRQIIEIMRSQLARNVHASDYLEAWIRGHFLNI